METVKLNPDKVLRDSIISYMNRLTVNKILIEKAGDKYFFNHSFYAFSVAERYKHVFVIGFTEDNQILATHDIDRPHDNFTFDLNVVDFMNLFKINCQFEAMFVERSVETESLVYEI